MDLGEFWDKKVPKPRRHIVDNMPKEHCDFYVRRFKEKLWKYIPDPGVVLDWGCGGGLLAKEIMQKSEVICIDLSQDSLNECEKYTSNKNLILIPSSPDDFDLDIKADTIHSSAVIHHFPSVEYWNKVVKIWNDIDPQYIAIMVKLSDKNKEQNDYYNSDNYVRGLYLTKDAILNSFDRYKCIEFSKEKAKMSPHELMGFFVLKRK